MATELTIPTLGMDMTEATIVKWLVSEGDEVQKGDPVLEIDTDKTSFEVESPGAGVISTLTGDEGETLEVGTRVAYILAQGEEVPESPAPKLEEETEDSPEPEAPESEAFDPEAASSPSESSGEHSTNGSRGSSTTDGKTLRASPAARKLAVERGIELSEVAGSGPNGRVYLSDVQDFEPVPKSEPKVEPRATFVLSEPATSTRSEENGTRRETLSQVRKIGAARTQQSFSEVPHFYLRRDMDAERIVALRARLKDRREVAPSLNDLIAFAVSRTLVDHPRLNGRFDDGELVVHESVNLGIATATEKGLVVPVVKSVDKLRLTELTTKTKELLSRARDGKLNRDELSGGTFTISNLGMMGVDSFDAIINQPEAAILAVGSLRTVPLWDGDLWIPRLTVSMTLSVDHRVADGADGARFLSDLQNGMSDWELLM